MLPLFQELLIQDHLMKESIQFVLLFQKKLQMLKTLMMDLLFKNQAQVVFEQAPISPLEQLMQVMYSIIVIQGLSVPVLHLELQLLLEQNYLTT